MTRPHYNHETWPPAIRHHTYNCHLDDCGETFTHESIIELCEDYADHVRNDHGQSRPSIRTVRQGVLKDRTIHAGPAPAETDVWAGYRRRHPAGDPGAAEFFADPDRNS